MVVATETKVATITERESRQFVCNLVKIGLSSICFLRRLFPQAEYSTSSMQGEEVWTLQRGNHRPSNTLLNWIELGLFDAIEKQFLKTIIFSICRRDTGSLFESYTFRFTYPDDQATAMSVSSEEQRALVPRADILSATLSLLKSLKESTDSLPALPECGSEVSMKLYYYDTRTPSRYEPPLFTPGNRDEKLVFSSKPVTDHAGDLMTGYHGLRVVVEAIPQPEEDDQDAELADDMASVFSESIPGTQYPTEPSTQSLIEGLRRGTAQAAARSSPGSDASLALDDEDDYDDDPEVYEGSGCETVGSTQRLPSIHNSESCPQEQQQWKQFTYIFDDSQGQGPARVRDSAVNDEFLSGLPENHTADKRKCEPNAASSDLMGQPGPQDSLFGSSSPLSSVGPCSDSGGTDDELGPVDCVCGLNQIDDTMIQCKVCKAQSHPSCYGHFSPPSGKRKRHVCYSCDKGGYDLAQVKNVCLFRRFLMVVSQEFASQPRGYAKWLSKRLDCPYGKATTIWRQLISERVVVKSKGNRSWMLSENLSSIQQWWMSEDALSKSSGKKCSVGIA